MRARRQRAAMDAPPGRLRHSTSASLDMRRQVTKRLSVGLACRFASPSILLLRTGPRAGCSRHTLRQRDGENAPFVDALVDLAKARAFDELIHFGLRPPAHHPGRAVAM